MKIRNLLFAFLAAATLTGCGLVTEDGDDTNCGLFVAFKYDYNLQRADMFKDHVGGVTLYVFDNDGNYLRSYEENDIASMGMMVNGEYMHCMHIQDLPDGDYRFIALCNQKPYEATLGTKGAKYRRTQLTEGDNNEKLTVRLDATDSSDGTYATVSNEAPLDTLWHGMTGSTAVKVSNHDQVVTTISLTRDTKMLTIGLHNLDEGKRADIDTDDFTYYILDNNGVLAYNNDIVADKNLIYTPFYKWNTYSTDLSGNVTDATAHACITFNRLKYYNDPDENALLVITNKNTGKQVAAINLTEFLAQGRNAYDLYAYSKQEYLDRAYDYYMDFFIKNDTWQYAEVRINVLSWAKRIQNVDLK